MINPDQINLLDTLDNTTEEFNISEWNNSISILNSSGTRGAGPLRTGALPWGVYPTIGAAQLLSFVCLLVTVAVYRHLPEFRNVPGYNLVTLCLCLAITYTLLFVDFVFGNSWVRRNRTACVAVASGTHFFFLAVFAWTTVLAYDIWQMVSRTQKPPESCSEKNSDGRKRYLRYSCYAWISTALISSPALIQAWTSHDFGPTFPKAMLGVGRCWLNGKMAFLVYFNSPVGIALLANMIFFAFTAKTLIQIRNLTNGLNVKQQKQRFYLYVKLFLVMGLVWITEFIPLVTGIYVLYAVAGFLTSLYGVVLFLIFICKRRIWKALQPSLAACCCKQTRDENANQAQRTRRLQSTTTLSSSLSSIKVDGLNVSVKEKGVAPHKALRKNSSQVSNKNSVCEQPM